jgi:5-methylcytosine-specific restriction endonuclease McrA
MNGDWCVMRRTATQTQRLELWLLQNGLCAICTKPLPDDYQVDHIQPWTQKGPTKLWNLQALCVACHCLKTSAQNSGKSLNYSE